ncbi:MAG: hypothetical protein QOJ99_5701 [Bryobacterales bacterium]|jgi:parallel beta-helix repeat protein|nr:hypothetical protein [Bryobacterales bacterium]
MHKSMATTLHSIRPALFALVAGLVSGLQGFSQNLGTAPPISIDWTDLYSAYRLPPLRDRASDPLERTALMLKVVKRANSLNLTNRSATDAWGRAQVMLQDLTNAAPVSRSQPILFSGTTSSELNRLLVNPDTTSVYVASSSLNVDEPIRIAHDGVLLDLGSATLNPVGLYPYLLRLERVSNAEIAGGLVTSGDSGVLISQGAHIVIRGMKLRGLKAAGIVVTHSNGVVIRDNAIAGSGGASVVLHVGTYSSLVARNEIIDNTGWSNMAAGIVVTDREVDVTSGPGSLLGPGGYWVVSQTMSQRINPPHDNVIALNHLASNNSSGVYLDGAVENVVVSNIVERNGKEGICLDNGSTSNVVIRNVVQQNGNRWGQPDYVLAQDFVAGLGRLQDGTAAAKVPGISVDNALYNVIYSNTVSHNFGGGIKVVRTGYYNLIGANTIVGNNDGASSRFHFFGIDLGAAALDAASDELDGGPSRGNIVFSNLIRGNHFSGIYFDNDSDQNDIFDNVIMDAQRWALESVKSMPNSSLNNLTNLASRNISSGLSPALIGGRINP